MFISALNIEPKDSNGKFGAMYNTRSQSSLSNASSKSLFPKSKATELSKNPSVVCLEITQMSKCKHDLEKKVLTAMQEMKTLKSVSKNLKEKEHEMENLYDSLLKSNEELQESKSRLESSEKLINQLFRSIQNDDELSLLGLYSAANTQLTRIRQKRNSLIIDDLVYKNDNMHGTIKTARDVKIRSPYFSHSSLHLATTPRNKRLTCAKSNLNTNKSTPKLKKIETAITDNLQLLLTRTMRLIDKLSK